MISEAHQMAEQVEAQLRTVLPEVHRITIHTEPFENEKPGAKVYPPKQPCASN
jgi:divalent metal cation (Fe/Co/Zn/Cd) transporter